MAHYYEKTIVDSKDIYTEYLLNVLTPLLYEGIFSLYEKAQLFEKKYAEECKKNPSTKNPGVIVLFQHFLCEMSKLNDNLIVDEATRIKDNSKCADIFDDLIKAVIKSHIIVLTYTASRKTSAIVNEKFHEKIETKTFVHACYLECSRLFYDHPMLFWHDFKSHELKENQRIIYQLIKIGIKNAIKRSLPMKEILDEFLRHDYIDNVNQNSYVNVRDMLQTEFNKMNNDESGKTKIVESTESAIDSKFININDDEGRNDLSKLIYGKNTFDTIQSDKNQQPEKTEQIVKHGLVNGADQVPHEINQQNIQIQSQPVQKPESFSKNANVDHDIKIQTEKFSNPDVFSIFGKTAKRQTDTGFFGDIIKKDKSAENFYED